MKNQVWCSHMDLLEDSYRKGNDAFILKTVSLFGVPIKFCPICAAPRPVEKDRYDVILDILNDIPSVTRGLSNDELRCIAYAVNRGLIERNYRGKV